MDAFVLSFLAYCCAWLFVRLIQYVDEGNCRTNAMNRFMKNGTRKMSIHLAHDFTWAQLSADIWWVQQCQGTLTWIKLTIVLYLASSNLRRHRRKPRSCGLEMALHCLRLHDRSCWVWDFLFSPALPHKHSYFFLSKDQLRLALHRVEKVREGAALKITLDTFKRIFSR
jgi:hypothetical protein